jgi:hypothetical protein
VRPELCGAGKEGAIMKSILDPSFRYTPSAGTDLRKTFARIRRELLRQGQPSGEQSLGTNVLSIAQRKPAVAADPGRLATERS